MCVAVFIQGCVSGGTRLVPPTQKDPVRKVAQFEQSPCNDSIYVALRSVALEDMTQREYEYFTRKDTECAKWQSDRDAWEDVDTTIKQDTQTRVGVTAALLFFALMAGAVAAAGND